MSALLEASRFGHFVLRSLQNGSTGSKCRDCDTRQSFSSTAIAVTPACVSRPCALTFGDAGELLCPHLVDCACVSFRRVREVCRIASPLPAMRAMQHKIFDDDYSPTPKMEQDLSTHTQQEPAAIRNSWRELLEIVDSYLTRHGVNG